MPARLPALVPRAAFAGMTGERGPEGAVVIEDLDGLGIAAVVAGKGQKQKLEQRLRECFDIPLPQGPRRSSTGPMAFVGIGVGAWLATCHRQGNAFAASLRAAIGDLAAVSDQSDGYSALRIRWPAAREVLSEMVGIDLHPRSFKAGDVAVTVAESMGVTLWRLEDDAAGSGVFEVAVYRSLAADFGRLLLERCRARMP
jgi:heterotetrameric sarcosine oxidase gamma subunit